MSLIHFITLWLVQTMGSQSWCSHFVRRACRACVNTTHRKYLCGRSQGKHRGKYKGLLRWWSIKSSCRQQWKPHAVLTESNFMQNSDRGQTKNIFIHSFKYDTSYSLTSLSKLSICSSWIARSMLVWWNWSLMLRNLSRSLRLREFSTRPSTKWVWKVWEYWGSPTSLSHDVATQWWSISDAFESLEDD